MSDLFYHLYTGMNVTAGIVAGVFTILFLFLTVPKAEALNNYIICRRLLATTYFFYSFFCIIEFLLRDFDANQDFRYAMYTNIATCAFSAVLIYFAMGTILSSNFFKVKHLYLELSIPSFLTIILFLFFIFQIDSIWEQLIFYVFVSFYLFQLIRFAIKLFSYSKWIKEKMDNYFSDKESQYLNWVFNLFLIAFIVGILNIAVFFIDSYALTFFISVMSLILFVVLGIKYLNYVYYFNIVSPVVNEQPIVSASNTMSETESYAELDHIVLQWINKKSYLKQGITIVDVAQELNTNRTYLSNYINTEKAVNFSNWINGLRIEEAKRLMQEDSNLSIADIAYRVGYTDVSSFSRNFSKFVHTTPNLWRKNQY